MLVKIPFNVQLLVNKTNKLVVISPKGFLCFVTQGTFFLNGAKELELNKITTANKILESYIRGLSRNYKSVINLSGIGYKILIEGRNLVLTLGFSYKVYFFIPLNITCDVKKNTTLRCSSYDYKKLKEFTYSIQKLKEPNAYSGKGVQIKGVELKIKKRKSKT